MAIFLIACILKRFETVKYVEAAAENLPFPDKSFDAISCVYLFHELPNAVRREVLTEIYRVLKPGGKLFFVDRYRFFSGIDKILLCKLKALKKAMSHSNEF